MLRYKRTTPLAGEPLEPLGYFSNIALVIVFLLLNFLQEKYATLFISIAYVNTLLSFCQNIF